MKYRLFNLAVKASLAVTAIITIMSDPGPMP